MKGKTKTQRGITLVALIITIVILLILAAVAVATIQNDGILSRANQAATQYNQKVGEEGVALENLYDSLNPYFPGSEEGEGGETPDPEGGTTTTYTAYTIGDEVKVVKNGVEHAFYVIENSDASNPNVTLLAKYCIDATDPANLVQSSSASSKVKFSTDKYWTVGNKEDIPEETTPIPDSHVAAKIAFDYGSQIGGEGRLITYDEVWPLAFIDGDYSSGETEFFPELSNCENFWLGTSGGGDVVLCISTYYFMCDGYITYDNEDTYGVRPVIEISKTLLSQS